MASKTSTTIPAEDMESFSEHLRSSTRIMALVGAGLSASSGLPTFRGVGGMWRNHDATVLATPEAFEENPSLVWSFYSYRRHMALRSTPNSGHYALAELAHRKPEFITLSQNVDDLSTKAGHPPAQLHQLHGSLFDVKCSGFHCDYITEDYTDPIVPALAIPTTGPQPEPSSTDKTGEEAASSLAAAMCSASGSGATREVDISDASIPLPQIREEDLPHCPKCESRLRPGVVLFGEALPKAVISAVDDFINSRPIDLMLVIGTSAKVYPAAGYVDIARRKGARVAVINMDKADIPRRGLTQRDWFFQGDAGELLPQLLQSVISST